MALSTLGSFQSFINKCSKSSSGPSNAIHLTSTGTLNTDYTITTAGGYTFYGFANSTTLNVASIVGTGSNIYICVVGSAGGSGCGNTTMTNGAYGPGSSAQGGCMGYGIFNCTSAQSITITIGNAGTAGGSNANGLCNLIIWGNLDLHLGQIVCVQVLILI